MVLGELPASIMYRLTPSKSIDEVENCVYLQLLRCNFPLMFYLLIKKLTYGQVSFEFSVFCLLSNNFPENSKNVFFRLVFYSKNILKSCAEICRRRNDFSCALCPVPF